MQERYNVIISSLATYIINKKPSEDALREAYNKNVNYNPSTDYPEMFLFAFVENTLKNEKYADVNKTAYDKLATMYKEKLNDFVSLEKIIEDEFRLTMTLRTFNDDVLNQEVLRNMKSDLEKIEEVSGLEEWQKDALEKIEKKLITKNEGLSEKAPSYKEKIEALDVQKDKLQAKQNELQAEQYQKTIEEPSMILGVSQNSFQKMLAENGINKEGFNAVKVDDELTGKIAANSAVDNTSYIQAIRTVFLNKRIFKNANFSIDTNGILVITSGTKMVIERERIPKLCSVKSRTIFDRIRTNANKMFNKIKETKDNIQVDVAFIGLDIYTDIVDKASDVLDACDKLKKAVETKKESVKSKAEAIKDVAADKIRWDKAGIVSEQKPRTI